MLSYCNTMFLDLLHEDGLLVTAKGLGIEEVIYNMIKVYSDPSNLVFVVGLSEEEEQYFKTRLDVEGGCKKLPKKVTSEYSSNERKLLYLDGGVLFVTTRILVVDMLTERIPMQLITGILVARAHQTAESCQEAFILRMYRQKNKTGFIKAFSASPVSFTTGFCQVERVMRGLFVRNLYLWPRFHTDVVATIKQTTQPEVIELHINMTKEMMTIQTSVLDLINFSMQEIRRLNPSLITSDDDEKEEMLTVENAISKAFYKLLQRELDPIWHQLSLRTKQLVSDMKTLHSILSYLTRYDCITFHAFVSALRTKDNAMKSGGWMILDAAENLFTTAELRVFGDKYVASSSTNKEENRQNTNAIESFRCEENPKWLALIEILKEIKSELESNGCDLKESFPSEKVLVLTWDDRVAQQLQDVLTIGSRSLMIRMFNRSLGEKYGFVPNAEVPKCKEKQRGKQSKLATSENSIKDSEQTLSLLESPVTIIQSMHIGQFALYKFINELKPRYVVLYDVQVSAVRQLEVFQASNPDHKLKAYIMIYGNSTEEQAYLTSLRKEKEAFEKLIKEKTTMVIPEHREGREGDSENVQNPDLARNLSIKASDPIAEISGKSSRKGFEERNESTPKVIVDMREFRSELPSILHKRGIDIEPVTIEVGDYILTPQLCIERKSISDLIGSLQSGRLYNQATAMTRFYAKPMLLIEFDHNKPFALQGKYYLSKDAAANDLVSRLQLLTIHFPKVCLYTSMQVCFVCAIIIEVLMRLYLQIRL